MQTLVALCLFLAAMVCTFRTGFVQFRRFLPALRCAVPQKSGRDGVSPFEAAATSLGAAIGTGNIAGVAGAVLLGGPGVLFWMWMSALFGMASKYCEIYLGLRYRTAGCIGPMAYMREGLPQRFRFLAAPYALLCTATSLCMGNLVQINTAAEGVLTLMKTVFSGRSWPAGPFPALLIGFAIAVFIWSAQSGGAVRVGRVSSLLVPLMSVLYIAGALLLLAVNRAALPAALGAVLRGALRPQAFLVGISRGMFSHEAGLGTSALAHGSVHTQNAHAQALYGVFEVFFDTIVICTLTGLALLTSGIALPYGDASVGSGPVVDAFALLMGRTASAALIAAALSLFAITSILSASLYGMTCVRYLFGDAGVPVYRVAFFACLLAGACMRVSVAWTLAEWVNMLLALVNLFALLMLTKKGLYTKDWGAKKKKEA